MRRWVGSLAVVLSALAMSACGGGSGSGSGSVTGDAAYAFDVKSAFLITTGPATAPDLTVVEVVLTDQAWSCDDLKASGQHEPGGYAIVTFSNLGQNVAAGDFSVDAEGEDVSGPSSLVQITVGDSSFSAVSGSATLTDFSADGAKGSFEASDGTANVSGTFDALPCDLLND